MGRPQTRWGDDHRKVASKNWMRMAGDHVQFESPMPSSGLRLADDDDDDEQASPILVEAINLQLFRLAAV